MIGVLVSGNGTNLQALIDAGLDIAAVASNRNDAYALERARAAGVPASSSIRATWSTYAARSLTDAESVLR